MKILQVIHDFVPEGLGGAEVVAHHLSLALHKRGHAVSVFCRGLNMQAQPYAIRDEIFDGLQVRRIEFGTVGVPNRIFRHDPQINQAFRDYLNQIKPDIVHFHHLMFLSNDLPRIAKENGAAVIMTLHDLLFRCPTGVMLYHDNTLCDRHAERECLSCLWPDTLSRKRKVYPWQIMNPAMIAMHSAGMDGLLPTLPRQTLDSLTTWESDYREAYLQADIIHSPSQFVADKVIDFGIPAERTVVIENGLLYEDNDTLAKQPSTRMRLGTIGKMPGKGTHVAIQAMRHLPPGTAELLVYGPISGHYRDQLNAMAQGLDVRFMGAFKQSQIPEIYSNMDILIFPSTWYENCPMTIREAYANRTPVITSNIGGMVEAVRDGIDGFHFAVGDPVDLANKMRCFIDNPKQLAEFQANIRPPFTADASRQAIEQIYHRLVNNERTTV
jgi:glycosyltransferase involved in cell wall biosynthesis